MRNPPKSELNAPTLSRVGFSGTAATAAAVLRSPPLIDAPAWYPQNVASVHDIIRARRHAFSALVCEDCAAQANGD